MESKLFRTVFAVAMLWLAAVASPATACYCGAGRYAACCRACCCAPVAQQCCTVMKTCQQVVYEQKQYTCYRTCYEPVWEQKPVTAVRYESETRYRQCVETVCKPVFETAEREVCYTVCRPVSYLQTVKVCGGHWETAKWRAACRSPVIPCAPAAKSGATVPRVGAGDDRQASGVREVRERDANQESALYGVPVDHRAARASGALRGVQGRAVSDDRALPALRGEAGSLYGHALRAAT